MKHSKVFLIALISLAFLIPFVKADIAILYVDGCDNSTLDWLTEFGSYPWIDNNTANYIYEDNSGGKQEAYFSVQNFTLGNHTLNSVYLWFEGKSTDGNDGIDTTSWIWNGITYLPVKTNFNQFFGTNYAWKNVRIDDGGVNKIDTIEELNNTALSFITRMSGGGDEVWLRQVYLVINYTTVYDPTINTPNLLFGGGFQGNATGNITIVWNHSGVVDNFEIEHSTDGVSFSHLAYTNNTSYNHTGLNNLSYHWYRVRSTHYNVTWYNSSWSAINLERVFFISTGAPDYTGWLNLEPLDISWFTSLIWIGIFAIGMIKSSKIIVVFAGLFGVVLGLIVLGDNSMVGTGLILLNFYLIFEGTDQN